MVTDLGTLGGMSSDANALNDRATGSWAAVTRRGTHIWHAFLWANGKMRDLGSPRGVSYAFAINEHGQTVGSAETASKNWLGYPAEHAFLWESGRKIDLGTLGGAESTAEAINGRGQVVGSAEIKAKHKDGYPTSHAFLWENGHMRDLGTLGGSESYAIAINERGQVVGWAQTKAGVKHAFLWENGRMRDLGTLGGSYGSWGSWANAINDRGHVVGQAVTKTKAKHAFLWQNGQMRSLGTLGGSNSEATAINERGQVVGWSWIKRRRTGEAARKARGDTIQHAFLWEKGRMRDLGTGDIDSFALAVNDRGQVVAQRWTGKDIYGNLTGQRSGSGMGHSRERRTRGALGRRAESVTSARSVGRRVVTR